MLPMKSAGFIRRDGRNGWSGGQVVNRLLRLFGSPVFPAAALPVHITVVHQRAPQSRGILVESRQDPVHLLLAVANPGLKFLQDVPEQDKKLLLLDGERLDPAFGRAKRREHLLVERVGL